MDNPPFVHLRLHTAYSLCEGAVKISDLVTTCINTNIPAIAITDTNNMFGALEFATKCASNGIQPIHGLTIDITFEDTSSPIVLLAKNELGYKNLMKLMTCFYIKTKSDTKFITMENLAQHKDGIMALSGGANGLAGNMFLQGKHDKASKFLHNLHLILNDNFYIEISRTNEKIEQKTEQFFIDFVL